MEIRSITGKTPFKDCMHMAHADKTRRDLSLQLIPFKKVLFLVFVLSRCISHPLCLSQNSGEQSISLQAYMYLI